MAFCQIQTYQETYPISYPNFEKGIVTVKNRIMSKTAQTLPDNYYQILLKTRVVGEDERLPEHCPDALQGTFTKNEQTARVLIEVKIIPITCCSTALNKKKDTTVCARIPMTASRSMTRFAMSIRSCSGI